MDRRWVHAPDCSPSNPCTDCHRALERAFEAYEKRFASGAPNEIFAKKKWSVSDTITELKQLREYLRNWR